MSQKTSQIKPEPEVGQSYPLPDLQLLFPHLIPTSRDSQIPTPHSQLLGIPLVPQTPLSK